MHNNNLFPQRFLKVSTHVHLGAKKTSIFYDYRYCKDITMLLLVVKIGNSEVYKYYLDVTSVSNMILFYNKGHVDVFRKHYFHCISLNFESIKSIESIFLLKS